MTWWIASLVSNVAIIWTEYLNRNATDGMLSILPQTLPLIVIAQFCLFKAFNGAPHWFLAWAFFSIGNSIMRVGAVAITGEQVSDWPLVMTSIAIMTAGAYLMKIALE